MMDSAPGFYGTYASYKGYVTPTLRPKERRRFDADIWRPGRCDAAMSFLEIGCGTGQFLAYLAGKGVKRFLGIDHARSTSTATCWPTRPRSSPTRSAPTTPT